MFCEYNILKKRPSFKPASESLSFMRKYADISVISRLLSPISGFLIKNLSLCLPPLRKAVFVFLPFTLKVSANFPKKMQGLCYFYLSLFTISELQVCFSFSENTEWQKIFFLTEMGF